MFADIANEFQNITKFDLLKYFTDCRDFFQNDYGEVYNYFSGKSENIDVYKISTLNNLVSRSSDLIRTFQTFSGKLGNVGYWELQQYCQDLRDTLERVTKLPKYCRTVKTSRGYKKYIQVSSDLGGMKSTGDLAVELGGITEDELILNNDLDEVKWEIDKLSSVEGFVDNSTDVVVTTILEQPVGRNIYGKDICRFIDFEDNDLKIVKYEDNIEQKVDILLELHKGDVPEFPNLGKNIVVGQPYSNYNYSELISDIQDDFLQDDLFLSADIVDLSFENGDIKVKCEIRTKYSYSTTKSISI